MTIRTFVPHPIAEWKGAITGAGAAIIAQADRAVSDLNRDVPSFAGLDALSRQLLRQESVASSRIEGLMMGQRRLARAAYDAGGDDTARQIVGNIRAMERAVEVGSDPRPFTCEDLIEIHRILLAATRDRHLAGVVRSEQNWVGGSSFSPADAEFIPPPSEFVHELLDDLAAFVNREDLPASHQAAAAHAQFESIHPFVDGNGRVGRCLIHVVLRRSCVAAAVVPPISLILAARADDYVRGLDAWRGTDPVEWCLFFGGVVITSVREARRLAAMVERLRADWLTRAGTPRRDSSARRLIEQLPAEPIMSVARAMEITDTSRPAADRAIITLERAGVLRPLGNRRRNRQWEAHEVFDLLDRFERELAYA